MVLKRITAFLVVVLLIQPAMAQVMPSAEGGVLDASGYSFSSSKPLKLNGEWAFYPNKFVEPFEVVEGEIFTTFPHQWDDEQTQGYATYKLTVVVNEDVPFFALDIPQLYSAYSLYVNGNLVAKNGTIGTLRKDTHPQWLPQVVTFKGGVDTLSITLQIANFHHVIGGSKNPIYLGLPDQLVARQSSSYLVNLLLLGVLSFLGIFFLSVYVFAKRERSVLFFSLLCLTWALRSIFSEQYLAIRWMPWFDWELGLKIEYITLYLTMAWAILVIAYLYPLDTNKVMKRILLFPNFVFVFLTMATPAILYTSLLNIYLLLAGALLIYIVVVILRAMLFERYGAWFSVFSLITLAAAFGYNYLSYQGVFEFYPLAFYSSYLIFFFFLAIAIAHQLSPKASGRNYSESLSFDEVMSRK